MKNQDSLKNLREMLKKHIEENYTTTEEFCWDKDLTKSTISDFLNGKNDFKVSTLEKIANALNKKLIIKLE